MIVVMLVRVLRLLRQIGHLRTVEIHITSNIVRQSIFCRMTIAQIEFHTPVLQCRSVDPSLTTKTDGTEEGRLNEHVLGLFKEEVIRTIELAIEE